MHYLYSPKRVKSSKPRQVPQIGYGSWNSSQDLLASSYNILPALAYPEIVNWCQFVEILYISYSIPLCMLINIWFVDHFSTPYILDWIIHKEMKDWWMEIKIFILYLRLLNYNICSSKKVWKWSSLLSKKFCKSQGTNVVFQFNSSSVIPDQSF